MNKTWIVKDGKLYCGGERVAVRRSVVFAVVEEAEGPVGENEARRMIFLERRLSLYGLSELLAREALL